MRIQTILLLTFLVTGTSITCAQTITGPTSVCGGTNNTYTITGLTGSYSWSSSASFVSPNANPPTSSSVTVKSDFSGSVTVNWQAQVCVDISSPPQENCYPIYQWICDHDPDIGDYNCRNEYMGENCNWYDSPPIWDCHTEPRSVTLNWTVTPVAPPQPTINYDCASNTVIITKTADPNSYWQTVNNGQSTADNSTTRVVTTPGSYFLRVKNASNCWSDYKNAYVNLIPTVGNVGPNTESFLPYSGTINLTGQANGTVQKWQQKVGAGAWTDIANTSTTYAVSNVSVTTQYRAMLIGASCVVLPSAPATITIYPIPVITSLGQSGFPYGGGGTVSLTAGTYNRYQWYKDGVLIAGATLSNYSPTQTGKYTVQVWGSATSPASPLSPDFIVGSIGAQQGINVVSTTRIRKSGVTETTNLFTLTRSELSQSAEYNDGLGRTSQAIAIGQTPLGNDIVQAQLYDAYGRSSKNYLPFTTSAVSGGYRSTALFNGTYTASEQYLFYQNALKVAHDAAPYAQTVYDTSPLARVLEQGAPGVAWQPGTTHTVKNSFMVNTAADNVRIWTEAGPKTVAPINYAAGELAVSKTTDENGNLVFQFVDKLGHLILKRVQVGDMVSGVLTEYLDTYNAYDQRGNLVFQVPPKAVSKINSGTAWSTTFRDEWCFVYTYDERNRLVEKKTPGAALLYYVYDPLDRLVMVQDGELRTANKWMFVKYDAQQRPVMQGIYINTTYTTRATVQLSVMDVLYATPSLPYYEERGTTLHGYTNLSFPTLNSAGTALEILSVNYYDDYDFDFNGTADYSYLPQGIVGEGTQASAFGLPTGSKKIIMGTANWLTSYHFYDKYNHVIQTRSNNHFYIIDEDLTTRVYDFEGKMTNEISKHAQKMLTWKNVANVTQEGDKLTGTGVAGWGNSGLSSVEEIPAGQDGWLEVTVTEIATNKMFGFSDVDSDQNYTSLDYAFYLAGASLLVYENGVNKYTIPGGALTGNRLRIERTGTSIKYYKSGVLVYTSLTPSSTKLMADMSFYQTNASISQLRMSVNQNVLAIAKRYTYDFAGRAMGVYQSINGGAEVLASAYVYNELGQVVDKKLHSTDNGTTFKQSVDYRTNIRGWLSSINNAQLTNDASVTNDDTGDYFGMELAYNAVDATLGNTAYYNGNISSIKWKSPFEAAGSAGQRTYKYTYDKSDKLKAAAYRLRSLTAWDKDVSTMDESMTYDHNGNMETLQRNTLQRTLQTNFTLTTAAQVMDNLTYTYASGQGNRMTKVEDTGTTDGFKNGSTAATEYTYNTNGSMATDLNKGITTNTTYNVFGKPVQINFADGRVIKYLYDGAGNKLSMKVYQGTTLQKYTDYVGSYLYENGAMAYFSSPEGRVIKNGSAYEYQYAITDHQGNTRVLFATQAPAPNTYTASFEDNTLTTESVTFQNYPAGAWRSSVELFDHTDETTTYTRSQLLNGAAGGQVGLAKTLKVFPGDVINASVFAKYWNNTSTTSNLAGFATALTAAFGVTAGSAGDGLKAFTSLNNFGGVVVANNGSGSPAAPKAFITILLFDQNFNFVNVAYDQINPSAMQVGAAPKVAHDLLAQTMTVKEPGYAYIYISNENPTLVDVYFDDMSITHTKTPVLQYNEYYPFGLQTMNSWTRDLPAGQAGNNSNNFLYNEGTELNATTGVYDLMFRNYDPVLGRFGQVDPMADYYGSQTPYNYANNDPVYFNDPMGLAASKPYNSTYYDGGGGGTGNANSKAGDYGVIFTQATGGYFLGNNTPHLGGYKDFGELAYEAISTGNYDEFIEANADPVRGSEFEKYLGEFEGMINDHNREVIMKDLLAASDINNNLILANNDLGNCPPGIKCKGRVILGTEEFPGDPSKGLASLLGGEEISRDSYGNWTTIKIKDNKTSSISTFIEWTGPYENVPIPDNPIREKLFNWLGDFGNYLGNGAFGKPEYGNSLIGRNHYQDMIWYSDYRGYWLIETELSIYDK